MPGPLFRLRRWLMWKIAPAPIERRTWGTIVAVQDSARRIQEQTPHPSQVDEDAQSIERRSETVLDLLGLRDGTD